MKRTLKLGLIPGLMFLSMTIFAQETGLAGYYADEFQGSKTASGESYDKAALTGAHKTLPFGSYVKVTRLDNKRSVTIKINDRGPYLKGRVIDLSRKAAEELDLITDGVANVKLEVVPKPSESAPAAEAPPKAEVAADITSPEPAAPVNPEPVKKVEPAKAGTAEIPAEKEKKEKEKKKDKEKEKDNKETPTLTSKNYAEYGLYKFNIMKPESEGFGVQVAYLTQYEGIMRQAAMLQEKFIKNTLLSIERGENGQTAFKIILGPFPDLPTATSYKENLKKKHNIDGFVVNLADIKY